MTDPYNSSEIELGIMREALKMMLKYEIPVNILTKAGLSIMRDIDVIKKFGKHISVGATMTFDNEKDSKTYEPNAATPDEREKMLSEIHKNSVRSWISFEPVIIPEQSINIIKKTLQIVDYVKIGKINNYKQLDKTIDWPKFLQEAIDILRTAKKPFYVKYDLRVSAPEIKLLPDEFNAPQFEDKEQDFLYE
jgi:DNA repair photolyase